MKTMKHILIAILLFTSFSSNAKESAIHVSIDGITTIDAFESVESYLKNLPGVINLSLNSVTETAVLYTLGITVSQDDIKKRLMRKYTSLPANGNEDIFKYRIQK